MQGTRTWQDATNGLQRELGWAGLGGSCAVVSTICVLESSMLQWQISIFPVHFSIFWHPLNNYEHFWNAEHLHVVLVYACSSRP